jgi:hypothetical protein
MQYSSSRTDLSSRCMAYRDNCESWMTDSRVMSFSVKSLNSPLSCRMQDTLRQLDRDEPRKSLVEGRLTMALGDDGAPLSHSSNLATLMILAPFEPERELKLDSRLCAPGLRSDIDPVADLGGLPGSVPVRICCQHSKAANQRSYSAGTVGRRCMSIPCALFDIWRHFTCLSVEFMGFTRHPLRSEITVIWNGPLSSPSYISDPFTSST